MALDTLPNEIIYSILSYISPNRKDLWSCSLVSHNLWDVATSILYHDINFDIKTESHDRVWHVQKEKETILLNTLASNPTIGAKVRTLSLRFRDYSTADRDEHLTFGQEQGDQAARNMPHLTRLTLSECGLARHIIANIPSYSQLVELNLRLGPEPSQWGHKHMLLERLKWEVPYDYADEDGGTINSWNTAAHVLSIAGAVFPEIKELKIKNTYRKGFDAAPHPLPQEANEDMQNVSLPGLCDFRYVGGVHSGDRELMLRFLQRNSDSLKSLAMAFGFESFSRDMRDYLTQVISAAPKLKSLTIPGYERPRWQSHKLPVWSDSAPSSANPVDGIEFFEMWNIGCPFSAEIGAFFSGWSRLRVLKIGVPLYEEHDHDGRPHFDVVAPEILSFVRKLPHSIEELYIELDNSQVVCDEDEDFDPIEEIAPEIFRTLPRLHTLDINAWIADVDVSTGYIPEKAIFCRRRPSKDADSGTQKKKIVWVSRLACMYQESYAGVENNMEEVEGDFEGRDAEEPWLGGKRSTVMVTKKYWVDGKYLLGVDEDPDSEEEEEY
ncbi:Hairy/enhancer-of-split with YRPW motif protein 2 [Clarireedia jacksonii]